MAAASIVKSVRLDAISVPVEVRSVWKADEPLPPLKSRRKQLRRRKPGRGFTGFSFALENGSGLFPEYTF